jgi:hypothetical protein
MAILNKRNAALGWAVWQVGKRLAKRRVRAAGPAAARGGIAASVLAVLAGLLFWWRKRGGDELP